MLCNSRYKLIKNSEYESSVNEKVRGYLLMEQPSGEKDGGDGVNSPCWWRRQLRVYREPVPEEEVEYRSDNTQKELVEIRVDSAGHICTNGLGDDHISINSRSI